MAEKIDPMQKFADELKWLQDNPEFEERPATIREFVGPEYLNIESRVRASILVELEKIMGDEVNSTRITKFSKAMFTGAIGIGKTTVASIVLPYLAHWCLCLKDPQGFFGLLPGSRIAFMQMSTSGKQAKEVVFGDVKARVEHSKWFQDNYPYDSNFSTQLRFPKEIWILPGDSAETTFEGYNILGGILDEADSHKITQNKDYAEIGYDTIHARISSRFGDRGFIMIVGQMKRANGFAARKFKEYTEDAESYAVRMTIWESLGWDHFDVGGVRSSFWFDTERYEIVPTGIAGIMNNPKVIEIPEVYKTDFTNNPQKALRDLAGIPPATGSPFIALTYKIRAAQDRWVERHAGYETPVDVHGKLASWFKANNTLKRVCHIDMAYASGGDSLGIAVGHVPEVVEIDGERKPYIVFDLLMRIQAPAGREIFLGDVRRIIYSLRDDLGFKLVKITTDGFQSTDTRQQFEKRRFATDVVSVDRQLLPYHDLREAIYDDRIEFPRYMVRYNPNDTEFIDIAYKELSELVDAGLKIRPS